MVNCTRLESVILLDSRVRIPSPPHVRTPGKKCDKIGIGVGTVEPTDGYSTYSHLIYNLFMFNIDPFDASNNFTLISNYWWKFFLFVLLIDIVLTIVFKLQKKKIEKIWLFSALILGASFVIAMIPMFLNIFAIYNY